MASMKEITCACGCRRKRMVRTSDIKRGWGKYFDKRCKAIHQEKRTGQYAAHLERGEDWDINHDDDDQSWDAHKDSH